MFHDRFLLLICLPVMIGDVITQQKTTLLVLRRMDRSCAALRPAGGRLCVVAYRSFVRAGAECRSRNVRRIGYGDLIPLRAKIG